MGGVAGTGAVQGRVGRKSVAEPRRRPGSSALPPPRRPGGARVGAQVEIRKGESCHALGRAATLEEQAKGPFPNAVEMGNSSRTEVIDRLKSGTNAAAVMAVYGTNVFDDVDVADSDLAGAIAAYERSAELAAFNDPMKGNCAACHISAPGDDGSMPLFTDFSYDNIGIPKYWHSDFLSLDAQYNPDGAAFLDYGLGGIVGESDLYGAFKVTTLRNIALTAPYGHNGYFSSLAETVEFYAARDTKPVCVDPTVTATQAAELGCWPASEFDATKHVDELGNRPLTKRKKPISWRF